MISWIPSSLEAEIWIKGEVVQYALVCVVMEVDRVIQPTISVRVDYDDGDMSELIKFLMLNLPSQ